MGRVMTATENILQLTASQAACLESVNVGLHRKTKIALHTKRDLKTVAAALDGLSRAKLIRRHDKHSWRSTKFGQLCVPDVIPDPNGRDRARGRIVVGSAAERLLATLDRPGRGQDLARQLGISRQRLLQLVVRFFADGRLKLGDLERPTHIIARSDDNSILLTRDQELLLSALPGDAATTVMKLKAAISMPYNRLHASISALQGLRLLNQSQSKKGVPLYELTADGRKHFQRRPPLHFAEPAPLPVRSDRVRKVLSYLAKCGQARIRDIANDLGIDRQNMNAQMQYLKRKGLARKPGKGLHDPYVVTDEGNATLSEMKRRKPD
jgi:DNA-binding MarR family transcriptional regulator